MDYHIAFSPELDIDPESFAAAWNEIPECRNAARAGTSEVRNTQFGPDLLIVVLSVVLGATGSALYDLIKTVLTRQGTRKRTEIMQYEQPDGSRLLIVTVVEE